MMACEISSTSSLVSAGFGRGGGLRALSCLSAERDRDRGQCVVNIFPPASVILIFPQLILFSTLGLLPERSVIGHLSPLPMSLLPLSLSSVALPARRTAFVESQASLPLPPSSCVLPTRLLRQIRFQLFLSSRSCRPLLRTNRPNKSLSQLLQRPSTARSLLELDLQVGRPVDTFFFYNVPQVSHGLGWVY